MRLPAGWRCAYAGLQNSGMGWYECRVALRLHQPTTLWNGLV